MRRESTKILLALALAVAWMSPALPAGHITVDGRLSSAQTLTGPFYSIPQSLGAVRGTNLFHSFGQFSLAQGETADFISSGMTNIIARVTGGSLSSIDGTLQAQQPGVNLYFINPGGISFGPNASLNVAGSFYASTANYLKLADGGRFDASKPGASVLTAASPAAFGFLGSIPAPITVTGSSLLVPEGKTIGLIGGNLTLSGGAVVGPRTGGTAHLVSAASAGEAKFGSAAFDVVSFERLGKISLSGISSVDVSERNGRTSGGGEIYIRGGELTMDASKLNGSTITGDARGADIAVSGDVRLASGASVDTRSTGAGRAGDITLAAAGSVSLEGSAINSGAYSDGDAGNIGIQSSALSLRNAALISGGSKLPYRGRGADMTIRVAGKISLENSSINSAAYGDGDAGNIDMKSGGLSLTNGTYITSSGSEAPGTGRGGNIDIATVGTIFMSGDSYIDSQSHGPGRGGDINVAAGGRLSMDFASIQSGAWENGDSGNIRIRAPDLVLRNGASIESSGSYAPFRGRGGNISVSATGEIWLDNISYFDSGAFGHGDAGKIDIRSGSLRLTNGASIESTGSEPPGLGRGGTISITTARTISMDGDSYISSQSYNAARGGDIDIAAGGRITMAFASILSGAWENGDSGNIRIRAPGLVLRNGASLESSGSYAPFRGRGGNISISATGQILLDNSYVNSAAYGYGDAGTIDIRSGSLRLTNGAYIVSSGSEPPGLGRGGSITITATGPVYLDNSYFSSRAFGHGDAGSIDISSGSLALNNGAYISSRSFGHGDAGSIDISSGSLILANGAIISSSGSEPPGLGRGGDIVIRTSELGLDASHVLSYANGPGNGGNITILADAMTLAHGSQVSASTFQGATGVGGDLKIDARLLSISGIHTQGFRSALLTQSGGAGDAGQIVVNVDQLALSEGGVISASGFGTGRGGNVTVFAANGIAVGDRDANIAAVSLGTGSAGSITINAGPRLVLNGGSVRTSTRQADGGDIRIIAQDIVYLNHGSITSSVQGGAGSGGNIFIDPAFVVLNNGSGIVANAFGGNGGNIVIQAGHLLRSPDSAITASSQLGISGNIVISAPAVDLSGGLVTLQSSYLDASSLLAQSCASRLAGNTSSFVVAGRGGIPVEPDNWLSGLGGSPSAAAYMGPALRPAFPMLASAGTRGCPGGW